MRIMRMLRIKTNYQPGVAALLVVLVIGAASLIIAFTASFVGIFATESSYASARTQQAFAVAQGCMDETFRRIALDETYGVGAGQLNLVVGNGSCIIEVTDTGGSTRQVAVTGTVQNYNALLSATITRNGRSIQLTDWEQL